jgi:CDP-diacylglycerol--glycerol-3-phosphate 3-phosphatidyltransferase
MANFMTFLRVLLVVPIVLSVLEENYTLALTLTLVGALSDLVDGRIARKQGGNGIGKLLDPLADKVFVLSILIALVEVGRVSSIPVVLLLFRELGVSFLRSLSASQGILMGASGLGKLKTFLGFLSLMLIMSGFGLGNYVLWASVGLAYISFYDYARSYLKTSSGLNYP